MSNTDLDTEGRDSGAAGRGQKRRHFTMFCGGMVVGLAISYVSFMSILVSTRGGNHGLIPQQQHLAQTSIVTAQPLPPSMTISAQNNEVGAKVQQKLPSGDAQYATIKAKPRKSDSSRTRSPAMTPTEKEVFERITYWKRKKLTKPLTETFPANPDRYVTFELDLGGFNNVRMAFEAVVTAAMVRALLP